MFLRFVLGGNPKTLNLGKKMYAVGRLGSYITRGVYTFSGPFHPFGGAMDIVVVQQEDGSFKSSPWYVRLGKFQGVLKANEKIVDINVNGAEANFHMYLYQRGEAFFMKEVDSVDGDAVLSPPSSSGEELDGKRVDRRPLKSVSLDYDFDQSNSVIDMSNVKRINSRRSRILGFVLGRKSMKEKRFQEGVEDSDVAGTESMECAEIAAGLLEVKWSTNLASIDIFFPKTSDVLGQFMPWSQTGVAHLFSAIKENGYQLLFLSARAISQSYQTRQFLFNIKQDRKCLPDGPVVISPDGLFPSLFREVIRRAPHEFKIACLEDIKACFPSDRNPFYAGFGKRDTDEFSDLKVGIPKGKIFIINPKEEVIVNRRIDSKSYTPLHGLVNSMFPPISKHEAEDYTRGISGNSHPLLLLLKCFCK